MRGKQLMSGFALKLLALITMTIDHFGAVLAWSPKYREVAAFMRTMGRAAFPVYCFLIAEGMRKSQKREMYLLRLLVFAFVSFVPFSLVYAVISWGYNNPPVYLHYDHINVFFTLFFGAAAIYAVDLIAERFKSAGEWYGRAAGFTAGIGICWLAGLLHTDYGFHGALVILAIYAVMTFINNRFLRVAPLVVWALWTYRYSEQYAAFAMIAPLLIILYDGTQGPKWVKSVKMFFYVYYPLHLTVVYWFSTALA